MTFTLPKLLVAKSSENAERKLRRTALFSLDVDLFDLMTFFKIEIAKNCKAFKCT